MAFVSKIWLYPIKSLDGVSVDRVRVLPSGALAGDREFAILDDRDRYINAKRTASIHKIRASFDLAARTVSLGVQDKPERQVFHLDAERSHLEDWFTHFFQQPARLARNGELGFPDDTKRPGPTFIAESSLSAIADWYPELSIEQLRKRFRANIEIGGAPAFWEDTLVDPGDRPVSFRVGAVDFDGLNPCDRCVVPTRDPETGEAYSQFQRIFTERRRATNPQWAQSDRFKHLYRLTTNTQVSAQNIGSAIHCQDEVILL